MSEPVSNAEVEDVLSSIRRLVSEDKRPLQTKARPAVADRLVLTPALRVGEGAEDRTRDSLPDSSPDDRRDWSVEDAAFEAEQAAGDADFTAEMLWPDAHAQDDAQPQTAEVEDVAEAEAHPHFPNGDGVSQQNGDLAKTAVDPDVAFDDPAHDHEAALDDAEDDVEDEPHTINTGHEDGTEHEDGTGDGEKSENAVRVAGDDALAVDDAVDHAPSTEGDADDLTDPAGAEAAKAATLSAKIEALETAIGNISDTWEPDSAGEDDYSGTEPPAMAWEDDTEPSVKDAGGPEPETSDVAPKVTSGTFRHTPDPTPEPASVPPVAEDALDLASDDQTLDEDALRDLISEIVREELQGALGERITRNVRKLVRREIHRALAAQDLE